MHLGRWNPTGSTGSGRMLGVLCFATRRLEGLNFVRKERGINVYGYAHDDMAPVDINLGQNKRALPERMITHFLACDCQARRGGKMERN